MPACETDYCEMIRSALPEIAAVGRRLADPFRSPFYRVPCRTAAEVIAALRDTAAAGSAQVAA